MRKDWLEIEQKYIHGVEKNGKVQFPTQRELAQEYGISVGELGRKAKQNNWVGKKRNYLSKLKAECEQKSINRISDEASELNVEAFKAARAGIRRLVKNLARKDDKGKYLPLKNIELEKISRAMLNFQKVARLAVGEPTENVNEGLTFKKILEKRYEDWQNN